MNEYEIARREAFLTQRKAAEILGVSRQSIRNWENPDYPYKPSRDDVLEVYKTHRRRV